LQLNKSYISCPQVLIREVELMQEMIKYNDLNHVVKFFEYITHGNDSYFVYEYCDESLESLLERKKLEPKEIVQIYRGIVKGMNELHSHEIIHRDFKPGNIMLIYHPVTKNITGIKTIDFTTSKRMEMVTHMTSKLGTIPYQAPEVREHGNLYSYEADYYSIGMITYTMMFGTTPTQDFIDKNDNFVAKMLHNDPKKRLNPKDQQISLKLIENLMNPKKELNHFIRPLPQKPFKPSIQQNQPRFPKDMTIPPQKIENPLKPSQFTKDMKKSPQKIPFNLQNQPESPKAMKKAPPQKN